MAGSSGSKKKKRSQAAPADKVRTNVESSVRLAGDVRAKYEEMASVSATQKTEVFSLAVHTAAALAADDPEVLHARRRSGTV